MSLTPAAGASVRDPALTRTAPRLPRHAQGRHHRRVDSCAGARRRREAQTAQLSAVARELLAIRPKLRDVTPQRLARLAQLLWSVFCCVLPHKILRHWVSIIEREWREELRLCSEHRLLEATKGWWLKERATKAYRLWPDIEARLDRMQRRLVAAAPAGDASPVVGVEAKAHVPRRRIPQAAIASRDAKKRKLQTWAGMNRAVPVLVPIDTERLRAFHDRMDRIASERDISPTVSREKATRLQRSAAAVLIACASTGSLPQSYVEGRTGRLVRPRGGGIHLQNVPKEVRRAAFPRESYDIDVKGCHIVILDQLCKRLGIDALAFHAYAADPDRFEEELAEHYQLDRKKQVKKVMRAVLVGCTRSTYYKTTAYKALGGTTAKRVFADSKVVELMHDIKRVHTQLIERWPDKPGIGVLRNEAGKVSDLAICRRPRRLVAFLLQGAEATILRALVRELGPRCLVLSHDGLTLSGSVSPDDLARLEQVVRLDTGYRVRLTAEPGWTEDYRVQSTACTTTAELIANQSLVLTGCLTYGYEPWVTH